MGSGVCGLTGLSVLPRVVLLNAREHASVTIHQPRTEEKLARDLRSRKNTASWIHAWVSVDKGKGNRVNGIAK